MVPNIVFAPNIRRTQNTDTGRKTQTQLIIGFLILYLVQWRIQDFLRGSANPREGCADLLFVGAEVLGKNCMNMSEFGSIGGTSSLAPPSFGSATVRRN